MKLKNNKAITLIALVITIIVLLILAGVTISTLSGENGLLNRAKEAKETSQNASIEENIALSNYENKVDEFVDGTRETSSKYKCTILFDGDATSGTITFLNGHSIEEFDTIKFVYGYDPIAYTTIKEVEYTKETWNWITEKYVDNSVSPLEINGFGTRYISIGSLTKTSFAITVANEYKLYRVYGINY